MPRWIRKAAAILLLTITIFTLAGCGKKDSHLEEVRERGTLKVLMNTEYPPYAYLDAEGNLAGADVMLAEKLAGMMGVELEIIQMNFADLKPALLEGEGDMIISAYPAEEDLTNSILYADTALYALVAAEDETVLTEADLEGKIIGVQRNTQGDIYVTDMVSAKNIDRYAYASEAVDALAGGSLEAVVTDGFTAEQICKEREGALKRVYIGGSVQRYCVAMPPESDLLTEVDPLLNTLSASGTIQAWVTEHTIAPQVCVTEPDTVTE